MPASGRAIWELGMEGVSGNWIHQRSQSCLLLSNPICQNYLCPGNPRCQDCLLSNGQGSPHNPRPYHPRGQSYLLYSHRDVEAREPPRPSHSRGNMATSCRTWRSKSSERRAEAKLTSSLPARPPYMSAHWSSRALWLLLTTFYWGRHLHHPHSSYCRGLPQWKNSPLWPFLPHQCPTSLLGPKDDTPPQILWRACLCVEPHQRQFQEDPPVPSSKISHPGTEPSNQVAPRHFTKTLTW